MADEPTIRRSLGWAFVLTWGQRAISALFVFVLAAILGPEAFGIVAMALVFLALVDLFLEAGFQTTIVQRENLEPEHLDSAFWLNLGLSVVLAVISFSLAGWWASVNDAPELANVLRVMSVLVIVTGLTITQQGYMHRTFAFRRLAVRANVAAFVGGLLGLILALAGAGVWALVAQQMALAVTSLVLLWAVSDWRPRFRFSRSHARDLFGFTGGVFLSNLGGFIYRRGDALLIGLFFTPAVVGVYRLADRFVDTILEVTLRPVGLVSLPHMSARQKDSQALRASVGSFIRITMRTTLPALLVLAACSDYVLTVIGPEWEVGSDALMLLCVVGIVKGLVHFTGPLLFAAARPYSRAAMLWFLAAINVVTVVLVGRALENDEATTQLTGMAGARGVIATAVVIPLNLLVISRVAGLGPRDIARWLPGPLLGGVLGIAAVAALTQTGVLEGVAPFVALVVTAAIAVSVTLTVMLLLDKDTRRFAQRLLASRRASLGSGA